MPCASHEIDGRPIIVADASRFSRTWESYERFAGEGGRVYDARSGFAGDAPSMAAKIKEAELNGRHRANGTRDGLPRYVESGGKLGSPNLESARNESIKAWTEISSVRLDEFRREFDDAPIVARATAKTFAKYLNDLGYLRPSGGKWTEADVRARKNRLRAKEAGGRSEVSSAARSNAGSNDGAGTKYLEIDELVTLGEILKLREVADEKRQSILDTVAVVGSRP